jgi:HEAT repeat protein
LARDLIRRNLHLRYVHIIDGASALGDPEAVPLLRAMLSDELDLSRRLTIAGALWKLAKDPVFLICLEQAKARPTPLLSGHIAQVLWLDDDRAVDFLIDLLDHGDSFVRFQALLLLNGLELGRPIMVPQRELPQQADDYRRRRGDQAFRERMIAAIHKHNREVKNGR